jgi:hypothetical protein
MRNGLVLGPLCLEQEEPRLVGGLPADRLVALQVGLPGRDTRGFRTCMTARIDRKGC